MDRELQESNKANNARNFLIGSHCQMYVKDYGLGSLTPLEHGAGNHTAHHVSEEYMLVEQNIQTSTCWWTQNNHAEMEAQRGFETR